MSSALSCLLLASFLVIRSSFADAMFLRDDKQEDASVRMDLLFILIFISFQAVIVPLVLLISFFIERYLWESAVREHLKNRRRVTFGGKGFFYLNLLTLAFFTAVELLCLTDYWEGVHPYIQISAPFIIFARVLYS